MKLGLCPNCDHIAVEFMFRYGQVILVICHNCGWCKTKGEPTIAEMNI